VTLYTTVGSFEKHFLDNYSSKQQNTMLANKDNSCSSLYVQLTVHIYLTIQ